MRLHLVWNTEGVGTLEISGRPIESQGAGTVWVLRLDRNGEGIALGFPIRHTTDGMTLDLGCPVVGQAPTQSAVDSSRGVIYADLHGPGIEGYIHADLDGPGLHGRIRADLHGPGIEGYIRADLDGPGLHGRIRADLHGPGIEGYIHADLDGPRPHGRIRADLHGPGIEGYIRADLDGPGLHGRIRADLDGPHAHGFLHAESHPGEPSGWAKVLNALREFVAARPNARIAFAIVFSYDRRADWERLPVASPHMRELLAPRPRLSSFAQRAVAHHPQYFEHLAEEQPEQAVSALFGDVAAYMLEHAPLQDEPQDRGPVRLGVCAPQSAPAGASIVLNFVAYHPDLEDQVKREVTSRNPAGTPHLDSQRVSWQIGTEVEVVVYGSHLTVDPVRDRFTWEGSKEQLDFHIQVEQRAPVGSTVLKTDVYVEGIRIKRIWLPLEITAAGSGEGAPKFSGTSSPVSAFVSYASSDRPRVLDRVASLIIRTGMEIVMDCITLRPNQRWRALIPSLIATADMMLLFWSPAAAGSQWVDWEWRHALDKKGLSSIEIHPLAPYSAAALPSELSELHSNDPLMVQREWEARKPQPSPDVG